MNDSDKASYGLTPMTILPDPVLHANGFYADTPDTVAVRLKWERCPYPNIYRQAVYAWRGTPSWYSGDILYPVVDGSELTIAMRQTAEKAEFVDAGAVKHVLTGLARGETYYFCVQAQADQEGGLLTDVYITKLVADFDSATPMVKNVTPTSSGFTVDWKAFAGYGFAGYVLYVWTGRPLWYKGDQWYNTKDDDELARQMGESAASFEVTDGTVTVSMSRPSQARIPITSASLRSSAPMRAIPISTSSSELLWIRGFGLRAEKFLSQSIGAQMS